jgi:hypothetical protein
MITIPPAHKYATLALDTNHVDLQFTEPLNLGDDLWVTGELSAGLPEHWQTSLGSLRVDDLKRADLFLMSYRASEHPDVLDAENQRLQEAMQRLYFGLLMAAPFIGHQDGTRLTGARRDADPDVRQVERFEPVLSARGCHGAPLNDVVFRLAKTIADGIANIQGSGEHSRVWRMVRAFYLAMQANEFGNRIHQFVRCVEGFVFPVKAKTEAQMKSRTELFLGPTQHGLMKTLFDVRSAVEHLHGPYRIVHDPDRRRADLRLAELSFKAEALARYCLCRLFTSPDLWPYFADDAALASFWALENDLRQAIWGLPLDLALNFGHFSERTARIQLFGV